MRWPPLQLPSIPLPFLPRHQDAVSIDAEYSLAERSDSLSFTAASDDCQAVFRIRSYTISNEVLFLVGSCASLGAWRLDKAVAMRTSPDTYPEWEAVALLPPGCCVHYAYVKRVYDLDRERVQQVVLERMPPGAPVMAAQAATRRSSRISPRKTRGVQGEQDLVSVTTAMQANADDERDHRHHRRHIESSGSAVGETSPDDERDAQKRPLAQTAGARRLRVPDEATLLEVDDGEWVAGAPATGTATAVDTIAVPELSPQEERQRVRALNAAAATAAASHRNPLTDEPHIAAGLEQREDFLRAFRHLRWTGNAAPRRLGALLLPARSSRLRLRASRDDHGFRLFKRNPSWFIALNIQAGIRLSLQQLELQGLTGGELDERDFFSSFMCDVGQEERRRPLQAVPLTDVGERVLWEFTAPRAYTHIRQLFGISNKQVLASVCNPAGLMEVPSPGNSQALFFLTHDEQFLLKTVTHQERFQLIAMLPEYYRHVRSYARQTLLPWFLALFQIQTRRRRHIRFVMVPNIFPSSFDLQEKYDLKGSRRSVPRAKPPKTTGAADQAAARSTSTRALPPATPHSASQLLRVPIRRETDVQYPFLIPAKAYANLMQVLERDTTLLQHADVMDYSLLVGVSSSLATAANHRTAESVQDSSPEAVLPREGARTACIAEVVAYRPERGTFVPYCLRIGIIDALQTFRVAKQLEFGWKLMLYCGSSPSVCPPAYYRRRFLHYVRNVFMPYDHVQLLRKTTPQVATRMHRQRRRTVHSSALEYV